MAVGDDHVKSALIRRVNQADSETQKIAARQSDAGDSAGISEQILPQVAVKRRAFAVKVVDEQVRQAITVEVAACHSHPAW